jgi:uncharacterized protein involved in exopolysaccharide biosynthesis/Mrp family chromosome partitioning ATPase
MNDHRTAVTEVLFGADDAPFVPGAAPFADQDGGVQLRKLFGILRRRSRLIAWIAIGGTLLVLGLALFLPPRYTAKAQVLIEQPRPLHIDDRVSGQEMGPDQATIQTQVTALLSHDLLANVLAQLAVDPGFRDIQRRGHGSVPDLSTPGTTPLALEVLQRHLNVFQESVSRVISVAYTSRDPAEAAFVANKFVDYYLAAGRDRSNVAIGQSVTVLDRKIADLRAESESLRAAVVAYQSAHGLNDATKTNVIDQKLGDLNQQLSAAQSELAARRARHSELLKSRGAAGDWSPLLAGLDAQALVDLHGQILAVLAGRPDSIVGTQHSGDAGPEGPVASQPLRDKVRKALDQALLKLSHDERVASAQVAAIESRLGAVQRASDDVQLRDLVAAASSAQHRYEHMAQRRYELLEQGDDLSDSARLLSRAAVPDRPSSVNPFLFLLPGSVVFLVIGCLVALWRDRMDQGIYSENDVLSALGLRCAGFIPSSLDVVPAGWPSMGTGVSDPAYTEALRGIVVSLHLDGLRRRKPQVVLVTSSVREEGKTTLARSLAACAARMGAKVLLLGMHDQTEGGAAPAPDPLLRREAFGEMPGLSKNDRELIEAHPTGLGNGLDYLPVQRGSAAEPSSLFSVDEMSKLLRRKRSNYDLIFIDSAPVLAKAEVRLLAAIADQVILAVRWQKTRRDDARAALALLRGHGSSRAAVSAKISAVITQVDIDRQTGAVRAGALSKYGEYSAS